MLKSLSIRNYALISELDIAFGGGLTTLTGETGAGKSILLGALSLVLGSRSDSSVLMDQSGKCTVEAVFSLSADLLDFLRSQDLDPDPDTIVRREISAQGKSRAFINDTPVNLSVLKDFGDRVVDVHSQHQNLILSRSDYPVDVIDRYGKLISAAEEYRARFNEYRDLSRQLQHLKEEAAKARADQDYLEFQLRQIEEARIHEDEDSKLEEERALLAHASEIHQRLAQSVYLLDEADESVMSQIRQVVADLQAIAEKSREFKDLAQRMQVVSIEINDLFRELESWLGRVEQDPDRLSYVEQRLDLLYALEQKHLVKGATALLQLADSIRDRLLVIDTMDESVAELEAKAEKLRAEVERAAGKLSESRRKVIPRLESSVSLLLKELGIPNARFEVAWNALAEPGVNGADQFRFMFAANKNQQPEEISKVASGGEISRLMLSVKSLINDSLDIPTMIFDEIDAGVSGEIAHRMGRLIRQVSEGRQVINITHLPQVAALGEHHFMVYKYDDERQTRTAVKVLNPNERIDELARMLSGDRVTEEAIRNATVLLEKSS